MASPFRYFRKHTKAFYAVASVIAIALFVFGRGTGGRGGSAADPNRQHATDKVATWNGGSINVQQLSSYVQQRLVTNDFLRMLFTEGGGQTEYDLPRTVPNFIIASNAPMNAVELDAINTEVFSSLATQAGMSVSDGMINHYLEEFGLRHVDSQGIVAIFSSLGQRNPRANEAIVFSTLRKLLLAYFYRQSYEDAGAVVLPLQRWEDWRRVNERISLEAVKLPVESFLDKVPEPTEDELIKLFEKFKEADPNIMVSVGSRELPSPNPAFAIPRRVKLQYLSASVAERTSKLLDTVTEQEIADYYERNKRTEFTKEDAAPFGADMPAGDVTPSGGEAGTSPDKPAGGAPESSAPTGTEPAAGAGTSTPATGTQPATSGTTEPAAPATSGSAAPPAGDHSQYSPGRSPFHLTALQAAPATETAAGQGADAPASTTPATGATPAEPATTPAPPSGAPAGDAPADSGDKPAAGATTDDAVEYEPLDKVRDQIRENLAREKAVTKLQQQMGEAYSKLQLTFNQYSHDVATAQDPDAETPKPVPPPPEKLKNLQKMADAYDFSLVTTAPLTDRELYDTPVGKATDDQSGRIAVTQAMFSSPELYEPFLANEIGDWYLVMKTEDTPRRVPEFKEVRDKVAAAWKKIEAAKLAEKAAKELAEAAEKDSQSFEEFFKDKGYEVIPQTALFSWRRYPLGPGMGSPPELSDIPELKNIGPDFMQAAFALDGTKTVALLNFDKSAAYVIRLHSRQYTPDELKKLFLSEDNTWPGRIDMRREHQYEFGQMVNRRIWEDLANFKFDPEWEKRREERLASRE